MNTEALCREQILALLDGWRVAREKATVTAEANTPWLLD
jgi:hypothetical protein